MVDHRGHWPGGEPGTSAPSAPNYIPAQTINLNVTINLGPEAASLLGGMKSEILAAIKEGFVKMDADIQEAIADVASLKSVVQSSNAAFKVLTDLNTAQAATIADLEAKIAAGTDVTADDLTALRASNADFKQALVDLQPAVPANTGAV